MKKIFLTISLFFIGIATLGFSMISLKMDTKVSAANLAVEGHRTQLWNLIHHNNAERIVYEVKFQHYRTRRELLGRLNVSKDILQEEDSIMLKVAQANTKMMAEMLGDVEELPFKIDEISDLSQLLKLHSVISKRIQERMKFHSSEVVKLMDNNRKIGRSRDQLFTWMIVCNCVGIFFAILANFLKEKPIPTKRS